MNLEHLVPEKFIARLRELHGGQVESWIRELPQLLDRCAERFHLALEAAYDNLSWNLLIKATTSDGTPVVLKVSFLTEELSRELDALRDFATQGAIAVIEADKNRGTFVMTRANPGAPLSDFENDDRLATEIFSDVLMRLRCPRWASQYPTSNEHFAALHRYRDRFNGVSGPLPANWVDLATDYLADLVASTREAVLLHGDLHHDNILRDGDDWVIIDPKGIIGDVHFDVIQFLLNYEDRGGDPDMVLQRRIGIICGRVGLDARRIAMWGVARGVLESCWALEDGTNWTSGIRITERFARLMDAL